MSHFACHHILFKKLNIDVFIFCLNSHGFGFTAETKLIKFSQKSSFQVQISQSKQRRCNRPFMSSVILRTSALRCPTTCPCSHQRDTQYYINMMISSIKATAGNARMCTHFITLIVARLPGCTVGLHM